MSCLDDSYEQITEPIPDQSTRLFFEGGFLVTDVIKPTPGSNTVLVFTGPIGFRANDDSMDIISEIDLTFDASIEGIGGLHPDHFPALPSVEYTVRIIGDTTGVNPAKLDAYVTTLGVPGLYPGYQKSRIVFKYVTSPASNIHDQIIAVHGGKYLVLFDINSTNSIVLINGGDDVPTIIDLSELVPTGIKTRVRLKNAFRIGFGGTVGTNSLQMAPNDVQTNNLDFNQIFVPQIASNTMTDKFDWLECTEDSELIYQVTDNATDRVNTHVYGYERTIGGDD